MQAVVWFVQNGGRASRQEQSEEAVFNAGCNPDNRLNERRRAACVLAEAVQTPPRTS